MIENAPDTAEARKSPSWRRRNLVIAAGMIAGLAIMFVVAVFCIVSWSVFCCSRFCMVWVAVSLIEILWLFCCSRL